MVTKEQLDSLQEKADALQEKLLALLNDSNGIVPQVEGLRLKEGTDLFTDEEVSFFAEIQPPLEESMMCISELDNYKKRILEEKHKEEAYAYSIRPIGESLEEIDEEVSLLFGRSEEIFNQLYNLSQHSTDIGWKRYIDRLKGDYDRIMTEAKGIVEGITIANFYETGHIKIEFPKAVSLEVDTPYYGARVVALIPTADSVDEIFPRLDRFLRYHRRALVESGFPTDELDALIEQRKIKLLSEPITGAVAEEDLEQIITPFPETYYFPKDKISNKLTDMIKGRDYTNKVQLASQKEQKNGLSIIGRVVIDFDSMGEKTSVNGLTVSANSRAVDPYEKLVINAVFTVWETARINGEIVDGEAKTTLHNLYRIISQNPNSDPTPEALDRLRKALMKLATGYISIDVSEEMEHHKGMGDFAGREGAFMQIVIDRLKINGKMSDVVRITRLDNSPLYTYAKITNRIAHIPMKQLDTKIRNKNEETMIINDYLLSRIKAIPHISNTIVLDTLLEECEIRKADYKNWKDKRAKTINKVFDLLDGYTQGDDSLLKGYKVNSKGKVKKYSVTLFVRNVKEEK